MLDADRLLPYTLAVIALILAPGPNQAMVVARSLNGGRRAGIMTSLGVNTGTAFHTIAAALGLSALLATSALAFMIVKLLGAAYLLYLGIRLLPVATTPWAFRRDKRRRHEVLEAPMHMHGPSSPAS